MFINKELSITYMSGPFDGKTLRFEQPDPGEELVIAIGRREGCDVHLPYDNQVSRVHARLGCTSTPVTATDTMTSPFIMSFWLEDTGSRNGTFSSAKSSRSAGASACDRGRCSALAGRGCASTCRCHCKSF